jgi:hypothetical protein
MFGHAGLRGAHRRNERPSDERMLIYVNLQYKMCYLTRCSGYTTVGLTAEGSHYGGRLLRKAMLVPGGSRRE